VTNKCQNAFALFSAILCHSVILVVIHDILEPGHIVAETYQDTKAFIADAAYRSFVLVSSARDAFEFEFGVGGVVFEKCFGLFYFFDRDTLGNFSLASLILDIKFNVHDDVLR